LCGHGSSGERLFLLLFHYLNVNKLISFQSFAVVYPYDNNSKKGGGKLAVTFLPPIFTENPLACMSSTSYLYTIYQENRLSCL